MLRENVGHDNMLEEFFHGDRFHQFKVAATEICWHTYCHEVTG
jgi:hypothetical protein